METDSTLTFHFTGEAMVAAGDKLHKKTQDNSGLMWRP